MILHRVIDAIPDKALAIGFSHIVRKLALHEICFPTLSVPLDQIFGGMLNHETVHCHIIAIDDDTVGTRVVAIDDTSSTNSVISPPEPEVVSDNLAGIDLEHAVCLHS